MSFCSTLKQVKNIPSSVDSVSCVRQLNNEMDESFKIPQILIQKPETESESEIPYKIPKWNGPQAPDRYSLEVSAEN